MLSQFYYIKFFICILYISLCLLSSTSYYNESCWFLENWRTSLDTLQTKPSKNQSSEYNWSILLIDFFIDYLFAMQCSTRKPWVPSLNSCGCYTNSNSYAGPTGHPTYLWTVLACKQNLHGIRRGSCESRGLWGGAFMDLTSSSIIHGCWIRTASMEFIFN